MTTCPLSPYHTFIFKREERNIFCRCRNKHACGPSTIIVTVCRVWFQIRQHHRDIVPGDTSLCVPFNLPACFSDIMVHISGGDDATPFTFRFNKVRDFATSLEQEDAANDDADRASTHRQLTKWGFSANTMQLRSIRYECEPQPGDNFDQATADFGNEAQYLYYMGWTPEELKVRRRARMDGLLTALFADKELLANLTLPTLGNRSALEALMDQLQDGAALVGVSVEYSQLSATVTSLNFFDELLNSKAVRKLKTTDQAGGNSVTGVLTRCGEEDAADLIQQPAQGPAVIANAQSHKITDLFLPSGVTVADLVRAFFLLPTTDAAMAGRESRSALYTNMQLWEEIRESVGQYGGLTDWGGDDGEEEEDSCKEKPAMWFNKLLLNGRCELLFHVFWRLVVGGGAMCQWSEQVGAYKVIARELYRDLVCVAKRPIAVTQLRNQTSSTANPTSKHTPTEDVDDGPSAAPADSAEGSKRADLSSFYDLVVQAEPVAIHKVTYTFVTKEGAAVDYVLPLFPQRTSVISTVRNKTVLVATSKPTAQAEPSATIEECMDGSSYCYMVLNPTRQEAVVWYHSLPL